jgi:hypothetical protein
MSTSYNCDSFVLHGNHILQPILGGRDAPKTIKPDRLQHTVANLGDDGALQLLQAVEFVGQRSEYIFILLHVTAPLPLLPLPGWQSPQ